MLGFVAIVYFWEQYAIFFPIDFWKILWGDKALMEEGKVAMGFLTEENPMIPPGIKLMHCFIK